MSTRWPLWRRFLVYGVLVAPAAVLGYRFGLQDSLLYTWTCIVLAIMTVNRLERISVAKQIKKELADDIDS